jgi:ribosomal protein L28
MSSRFFRSKSRIPIKRKTWKPPAYPRVPSGVPSFAAKPHTTYKLRNKILAGGKTIHFGNNVSEFKNRTRRIWRPNIKVKSLWSEALGRRVRLRMVTSVLRTMDKVGGLDAYLTCNTRSRMKELGPRGWEIRAAVIKVLREKERARYIRMFQRSILLYPGLRMDSRWKDIRPLIRHTEGYAVLPEEYCKMAFRKLMERLREGRPIMRRQKFQQNTIVLSNGYDSKFVRRVKLRNMPKHLKRTRPTKPPSARAQKVKKVKVVTSKPPVTAEEKVKQQIADRKKQNAEREAKRKLKAKQRAERKARAAEARIANKKKRKALLS